MTNSVLFALYLITALMIIDVRSKGNSAFPLSKESLLLPALKLDHVHVKDSDEVNAKIQVLINGNRDKLQVITDFGYTMTKFHANGQKLPACNAVIDSYTLLPPSFKEKSHQLLKKYHQIESDPSLPLEAKIPLVVELFNAKHELMIENNLHKKDFALMVKESPMAFRDGTVDFVNDLDDVKVPILIFSAGVGDVIDEALKQHDVMKPNVKVISNYMTYDAQGKLIKFSGHPINVFNKSESEKSSSAAYFQDVANRQNVILLGDSIGDLQMSHGVHSPRTVLTIGFLNEKIKEKLELYKSKFDIVLVDDQTMKIPHAILKLILANK